MAQNWSGKVNTRFYGQDGGYAENTEEITYKSGRRISYLKNSRPRKTHALKIAVDDTKKTGGMTEFEYFLSWYENEILSGTLSFYLPDVITGLGEKEDRMTEPPSWTGQAIKEISIQLEEV